MPYLKITTGQSLDPGQTQGFLKAASEQVAQQLGKPEQYMMVVAESPVPMVFAGTDAPCAFLELRGIGLPKGKTPVLSRALCELVQSRLGIPKDRVYINFADVPALLWGWNGTTF
ncbi:hypothetical protein HQ590_07065 [bacterium]|nr:hypothetical protein [bacterium]